MSTIPFSVRYRGDNPLPATATPGQFVVGADGQLHFGKPDGSHLRLGCDCDGGGKPPSPTSSFKYTIVVDNGADPDPAAVVYEDDCVGFTPALAGDMGSWADTSLIKDYFRPCVIAPGDAAPKYYLQQNNMTLKEDGSPAVLTGADGDVMIEIKKLYAKFTDLGTSIRISLSNVKEDNTWFCFNDIGGVEKDVVYRGAYKAGVVSSQSTVMRSISGVMPLVYQTIGTMRTYATNRGTGYHQNNPYLVFLYELMYLLMYRNRNSQIALGQGRTSGSNSAATTGSTNHQPFCYGAQNGTERVKFLGVEDFYGNVYEWVDGVIVDGYTYKLTRNPAIYNNTGAGYEIAIPSGLSANLGTYLRSLQLSNDLGFLPKVGGGSATTFWSDYGDVNSGVRVAIFGGHWNNATIAGAFLWYVYYAASYVATDIGSRLAFTR